MKLTSRELKRQARGTLTGRYGIPMAAFVIFQLIVMAISFPFNLSILNPAVSQIIIHTLASVIISLISTVFNCGLISMHLKLSRGKEIRISDLFVFFSNHPDRFILSALVMRGMFLLISIPAIIGTILAVKTNSAPAYFLMAGIWSLTMVPILILSFSYHLVYILLADRPDVEWISAFRESRNLMSGHKGRAFYISLSFIGMSFLCLFSLGIGFLWVSPYMTQTQIKFYQDIIHETA